MTADLPQNSDDYCYRHPDRRSYVLCQRCLRTVCPECQTQAAVGVICPECLKEQRASAPPRVRQARRSMRALDSRPLVTFWIMGVTAVISLIAMVPGVPVAGYLAFNSFFIDPATGAPFQPWRVLTVALVHNGFLHLGLNMLAVWLIGRSLEPLVGRGRFLGLYVLSALGGSAAMTLIAPGTTVVGASGAVFGLLGALLVIGRHIGANVNGILLIVGINLAIGLLPIPGFYVAWQAHVGGLAVGAVIGLIYARTRRAEQRGLQNLLLGALALLLVVLCALPAIA